MKKIRYIFIETGIRDGENEYNSKSVHTTTSKKKLKTIGNEYIKYFYDGESEKDGNGYYFDFGCLFVKCNDIREITEAEYDVLKNFM
jgi:hypothetical protein